MPGTRSISSYDSFKDNSLLPICGVVFLIHCIFIIWAAFFSSPKAPPKPIPQRLVVQTISLSPPPSINLQRQQVKESLPAPSTEVTSEPREVAESKKDPIKEEPPEPEPEPEEDISYSISAPPPPPEPPKNTSPPTPKPKPVEKPKKAPQPSKPSPKKPAPPKQPPKKAAPPPKKTPEKKPPAKTMAKKPPAPKKVAAPTAAKKKPAEPKEDKAIAEAKRKKEEEDRSKREADEKAAKARQQALAKVKEGLAKIEQTRDIGTGKSSNSALSAVPTAIASLQVDAVEIGAGPKLSDREISYRDELARRLKLDLKLPEYGDVKIKLTLGRSGKVVKVVVSSSESDANRKYIEKKLPELSFPAFGSNFEDVDQFTFTVTLKNER